ncbi:MAG: aldo/keto reductase [Thermodesulfobacteriota bacterium]|jgi:aryl-alcohol dehydrogenase-like predicted oxidoreductase
MQQRTLGKTGFRVSVLTLGGGGIGMVWGPTTDEECIETVKAAVASGVNILDLAPVYGAGKSEEVVGRAWRDLPTKPFVATKVFVKPDERKDLAGAVQRSVEGSLTRLGLSRVDVLQLHNQVEPQEPTAPRRLTLREVVGAGGVLEAMQRLKDAGVVRALGFTGIARHDAVRELFADGRLDAVQLVTNILCSEGEMGAPGDAPYRDHLEMVRLAHAAGLGVFGIRPFAAGALTAAIDRPLPAEHPVVRDFTLARQHLGFLATEASSLAVAAMRYALSLPGVSTVVTGAKNRTELAEAVAAAAAGPLPAAAMERIATLQRTVLARR